MSTVNDRIKAYNSKSTKTKTTTNDRISRYNAEHDIPTTTRNYYGDVSTIHVSTSGGTHGGSGGKVGVSQYATNADYATKSKYDPNNTDFTYNYLNSTDRSKYSNQTLQLNLGYDKRIENINPEELADYNYLYATQGQKSANAYLESKMEKWGKMQQQKVVDYQNQLATDHPVGAALLADVEQPIVGTLAGAEAIGNTVAGLVKGEKIDTYSAAMNKQKALRESLETSIDEQTDSAFGKKALQFGNMALENILGTAMFGKARDVSMALGAYSETLQDTQDMAISQGQAVLSSLAHGVNEYIGEHTALDNLFKDVDIATLGEFLGYVGSQMVVEGGEEVVTDILNDTADLFILRDKQNFVQNVYSNMEKGDSKGVAIVKAGGNKLLQYLESGIMGGLLGLTSAAPMGIANYGFNYNAGEAFVKNRGNVSELQNVAREVGAVDYADQVGTTAQVGRVFNETSAKINNTINEGVQNQNASQFAQGVRQTNSLNSTIKGTEETRQKLTDLYADEMDDKNAELFKSFITPNTNISALHSDYVRVKNAGQRWQADVLDNPGTLTQDQALKVYNLAVEQRMEPVTELDNKIADANYKFFHSDRNGEGTFSADGFTYNGKTYNGVKLGEMDEKQRAAYKFLKSMRHAGFNIQMFQSNRTEDGGYNAENGWYDSKTDTIYIDVNAGLTKDNSVSAIIPVFSHEVTHKMKYDAPAMYEDLRKTVVAHLANTAGTTTENYTANYWADLNERKGHKVSEAEMFDEMVAEACEDMIVHSEAFSEYAAELTAKGKTSLVEKLKDAINAIRTWIKSVLKAYEGQTGGIHQETIMLRNMDAKLSEIQEKWDAAAHQTMQTAQARNAGFLSQYAGVSEAGAEFSGRVLMGSLFSGGGTFEAGLEHKMLDKEFAVEWDGKIASVYMDNFGDHMFVGDVRDYKPTVKDLFYLHASPSCKNVSGANTKRGEAWIDKVTAMATARILKETKPTIFTVENVKGYIGTVSYGYITKALDEMGYKWDVDVYKASDYGNATKRERMFIRAIRSDLELPAKPKKTGMDKSWDELTKDLWKDLKEVPFAESMLKAVKKAGIDINNVDRPLIVTGTGNNGEATYAYAGEECPTLTTKCGDGRLVLPGGKVYSWSKMPEFMGRIHGMPENYKYSKTSNQRSFEIIGNGIPTQLTNAVSGTLLASAYDQTNGEVRESTRDDDVSESNMNRKLNLVAVHNTTEDKLIKALSLEGLPGISIAIYNVDNGMANEGYGDISLVFDKNTIDPRRSGNAVYGADIWSPTSSNAIFERQTSNKGIRTFDEKMSKLASKVANGMFKDGSNLGGILYSGSDATSKSLDDIVYSVGRNAVTKAAYLASKGMDVEVKMKPKSYHRTFSNTDLDNLLTHFQDAPYAPLSDELFDIYMHAENYEMTDSERERIVNVVKDVLVARGMKENLADKLARNSYSEDHDVFKLINAALLFDQDGRNTSETVDKNATEKEMDEAIERDSDGYNAWIKEQIEEGGVFTGEEGLYNLKDRVTDNGRRTFKQTHIPVTAANIVRLMNKSEGRANGYQGVGATGVQAVTAKKYSSIDDIRSDKGRLSELSDEEYSAIIKEYDEKLYDLAGRIAQYNNESPWEFSSAFIDAARGNRSEASIKKAYQDYGYKISDALIKESQKLYDEVATIPSKYFEAKATRVVGFNEIKKAIIPSDASNELVNALERNNIPLQKYKAGDNAERARIIENMDGIRFSLREVETVKSTGGWTSGKSESWFINNNYPVREDVSSAWLEARKAKGWKEGKKTLAEKHLDAKPKRVGTQIDGTKSTYENIFDYLKKQYPSTYKDIRVLDASSGLGLGTAAGMSMGFDVTDIEPYVHPDSEYFPDYMDYSSLQDKVASGEVEPFDFIISNAVLNVIPQDTRDNMVAWFDSVLADGGTLWVNTLDGNYTKDKPNVTTAGNYESENKEGNEIFVERSGSVQKGFFPDELKAYLKDALGQGYTVLTAKDINAKDSMKELAKAGSGAVVIVQKNGTESSEARFSTRDTKSVYDILDKSQQYQDIQNRLLNDVESLRERMSLDKLSRERVLSKENLTKAARQAKARVNSNYDTEALAEELGLLYAKFFNTNFSAAQFAGEAKDLARRIIVMQKPTEADEANIDALRYLRNAKIKVTEEQKNEAAERYGSLKGLQKAWFGKLKVSDKEGTPIDTIYEEFKDTYGWALQNKDASDKDMLNSLIDAYNTLRYAGVVENEYLNSEAIERTAIELYNQFWQMDDITKTAVKNEKAVEDLRIKHNQAMTELRSQFMQNKAPTIEVMSTLLQAHQDELNKVYELNEKRFQEYKDYLKREELVDGILNRTKRLADKLLENSKKNHVIEPLKKPIAELILSIDPSSATKLRSGIPTLKDISLSEAWDDITKALNGFNKEGEYYKFLDLPADQMEIMMDVGNQMSKIRDEIRFNIMDATEAANVMSMPGMANNILRRMDLDTLRDFRDSLAAITYSMNQADRLSQKLGSVKASVYGNSTIGQLDTLPDYDKKIADRFLQWKNATPITAFRRMGSTAVKIFDNVMDGFNKFAMNAKDVLDFALGNVTQDEAREWSDHKNTVVLAGNEYNLTDAQIMSIYALMKRNQAKQHMFTDYTWTDSNGNEKHGRGITISEIVGTINKEVKTSKAIPITSEDANKLVSLLSQRQKDVADRFLEKMNTTGTKWMDEVTLQRFGIVMTEGDGTYFPIKCDDLYRSALSEPKDKERSMFALLNAGFTQKLNKNADSPIVIGNFFDTWTIHMSEMAKYNGMGMQILDMWKWYSYMNRENETSVRKALIDKFGSGADEYIRKWMYDLNGSYNGGSEFSGTFSFLTSSFKVAATGANLSVALLQPTSYVRAIAVIDGKYLAEGVQKSYYDDMLKHSGIGLWKSINGYGTDVSRTLTQQIKQGAGETKFERTREWLMDKAGYLAGKMDDITWGRLWNACRLWADDNTEYKHESAEWYDAVNKKFTDVILRTQVVDSVMTRSQFMRSKAEVDKMVTSFMSEPTVSYNLLLDAYLKFRNDARKQGVSTAWSNNARAITTTIASVAMADALSALIHAFASAWRDPDDDKFIEDFGEALKGSLADDMSIIKKIPYVSDIVDIFENAISGKYYSNDDMLTAWATSLINAVTRLAKDLANGKVSWKTANNMAKATSQMSGIPISNVWREIKAIINNIADMIGSDFKID